MAFVDPNTIHNPATSSVAPAAWGDVVRDDLVYLATPPQAKVSLTANLSVTNNTTTVPGFTTEAWDTDGIHSTTVNTGRFTIVTAGKYELTASVLWDINAAGVRILTIRKGGATSLNYCPVDASTGAMGAFNVGQQCQARDSANAGDYYEITVYQNSGGALNVLADAATWFSCRWVGV
jgi:hypothetical protein